MTPRESRNEPRDWRRPEAAGAGAGAGTETRPADNRATSAAAVTHWPCGSQAWTATGHFCLVFGGESSAQHRLLNKLVLDSNLKNLLRQVSR